MENGIMETGSKQRARRYFTEADKRRIIRLFKESSLTVKDFCAREGVSNPLLYRWMAKSKTGRARRKDFGLPKPRPVAGEIQAKPFKIIIESTGHGKNKMILESYIGPDALVKVLEIAFK